MMGLSTQHTVVIAPEEVISWGCNAEGQCGQGERSEFDWCKPRFLRTFAKTTVNQVVCGAFHTLCVTATAQVGPNAGQTDRQVGGFFPMRFPGGSGPACAAGLHRESRQGCLRFDCTPRS
jgi:Regulator of chromosome condensation (RCC1) repeat